MPHQLAAPSIQDFPHIYPIQEQLRFLLRYAILAPSTRNTEPWRFTVEENRILLRPDLTRWQRVCDADRRELFLSLGCALENLLVAAEQVGLNHEVEHLPSGAGEGIAVAVAFGPGGRRSPMREGIGLSTLATRRTARGRYARRPVSDDDRLALARCVAEDDVSLTVIDDPASRKEIEQLFTTGHRLSFENTEFRRELADWVGQGAFGTPWPLSEAGRLILVRPAVARQLARLDAVALRGSPLVALISSREDDRAAQIRSGQVLERIWLIATDRGLGLQPLSAPLELSSLRTGLTRVAGARLPWAQQLVRIGHPRRESGHRSPRRPLDEVLDSPGGIP